MNREEFPKHKDLRTRTSAHDLGESILLSEQLTDPVPFPFCEFKFPASVSVSVVVNGASMDCDIDMLLISS